MATSAEERALATLCDAWLSSAPELVVWDFDNTIIGIHATHAKVGLSDVAGRWEAEVCEVRLMRAFVAHALDRGSRVGIASFGHSDVIVEYMRCLFAGTAYADAFTAANVATPALVGKKDGHKVRDGKVRLLDALRGQSGPTIAKDKTIFFDDLQSNIRKCKAAGYQLAYCVPFGFTTTALSALLSSPGGASRSTKSFGFLRATLRSPTLHSPTLRSPTTFRSSVISAAEVVLEPVQKRRRRRKQKQSLVEARDSIRVSVPGTANGVAMTARPGPISPGNEQNSKHTRPATTSTTGVPAVDVVLVQLGTEEETSSRKPCCGCG